MALYQPSNITPSTFAGIGGGVVDATDNISISWQVNGNSAMTSFSIQILTNDATPTTVTTLTPASAITPFNGTDAKGNPVFYVYEPGVTWASKGLSNGNEYRIVITQYWSEGGTTKSVTQNSPSVFITRAKPTLSISPSSSTLTSVSQTFTGAYAQAQNDSLAWVRWILSDHTSGEVLEDTGVIYTSVMSFAYDGLFNGESYDLKLTVETENGVQAEATGTYSVAYTSPTSLGEIDVQCQPDNSAKVQWAKPLDIPGTLSGSGNATYDEHGITFTGSKQATWDTVNGESMNIPAPWQFFWKGSTASINSTNWFATPTASDWEKVREYDALTSANQSVSVTSKDFERNTENDPTLQKTVTFAPADLTHVQKTETITLWSSDYTSYQSSIAGSVKVTFGLTIGFPVQAVHAMYQEQMYYNFIPNYPTDPANYATKVERYSDAIGHEVTLITVTIIGRIQDYNKPVGLDIKLDYDYYEGSVIDTPTGTNCRDFKYVSTTGFSGTVVDDVDHPRVSVVSKTAQNSCSVTYSYVCNATGDMAYLAKVRYYPSFGNLDSGVVTATTAPGGASVRVREGGGYYDVTYYSSAPGDYTATVKLSYWIKVDGAESYRCIVKVSPLIGIPVASMITASGNFNTIAPEVVGSQVWFYLYNNAPTSSETLTYTIKSITHTLQSTIPTIYSMGGVSIRPIGNDIEVNGVSFALPAPCYWIYVSITPTTLTLRFYTYENVFISEATADNPTTQDAISSVMISAHTHTFVGLTSNVLADMSEPSWNSTVQMLALFDNTLQAGTITTAAANAKTAIYRKEGTKLFPLGTYLFGSNGLYDHALRSNRECTYMLFYEVNGVYSAAVESPSICKKFKQYTLTEAEEQSDGTYLAIKTWRFANNIEASAVGNNNTPSTLGNFTQYPMWQPSAQSPKSGTLSALLGRFSQGQYIEETADDMDELYAISHSTNTFFLKDMKGNLMMVKPNGAISQSINNKSGKMEVTVSVPWVEVGDASKATILSF